MTSTTHPADALPLPEPFMAMCRDTVPHIYDAWANQLRAARREGFELAMSKRADEYRRAVMGEGKVAIGICKDADSGIPGIIYLDMGGEQRQIDEDTSDLFEPGTQADPSKILACVHFWTPGAVLQTIGVLHELLKKEFGVGPSSNVEALAPSKSNESVLRSALNAMLTQFGMDEDEWNKPTFDQARAALASQPAQEQPVEDEAQALINAGHAFWKSCKPLGGGAVRWLQCDDGTLIIFTRGEYRERLLSRISADYSAPQYVYQSGEWQALLATPPQQQAGAVVGVSDEPVIPLLRALDHLANGKFFSLDEAVAAANAALIFYRGRLKATAGGVA